MSLNGRSAPSAKRLVNTFQMSPETAEAIRASWLNNPDQFQAAKTVDQLMGTAGVEYFGHHKRSLLSVRYCNAGEDQTIVFSGPVARIGTRSALAKNGNLAEGL